MRGVGSGTTRAVLALERALERGDYAGPAALALAAAWAPIARRAVVRRLARPAGVRVVTVGGATLGGSGKTPVAIACAAELAAAGARVALVGHAYRAAPLRARVVGEDDALRDVGDEALLAARSLAGRLGACVVVAPDRADAVALASQLADVLVIDGVLQTAPVRASLALLAVDATEPWGRVARVPPAGHMRAPADALLAACDIVVSVGDGPQDDARIVSGGAWVGGTLHAWYALVGARVGLLCAMARPERLVRSLARRGVALEVIVRARDHGPFGARALALAARERVDLWLATPKCALHLCQRLSAPVAILDFGVVLSPRIRALLASVLEGREAPALTADRPGNNLKWHEGLGITPPSSAAHPARRPT
jgi:tetraacyldisaccharide 4'-kinase